MCCISLMSLGLMKSFVSVKNISSWVWIVPRQLAWRYRSKTLRFAVCIALDCCLVNVVSTIILPRTRSEWPGLMLHKRRIEESNRRSSGRYPGNSDLIGRLFQRQYSLRKSYMLQLCRNNSYRFQIVRLIREYIHRQGNQIVWHRLVCGVQPWKTAPTFKTSTYLGELQALWSYDFAKRFFIASVSSFCSCMRCVCA